jgi:N-acetylglucosamine-6-phosphate deacetylase
MQLINARLPGAIGLYQLHLDTQNIIRVIQPMEGGFADVVDESPTVDLDGDWVSMGGVDLQINGALGISFPELKPGDESKLHEICQFLWQQGIDSFLPTIVTSSVENIHQALAAFTQVTGARCQVPGRLLSPDAKPSSPNVSTVVPKTAQILGVHLEGPFLNPEKRGAHPAEHLLPLTIDTVNQVLGNYADVVKVVTLAPELDPTGEAIAYLRSLGIIVSLGHSQATASQATKAFAQGATMVTHAFNAMPPLHHREPGLLGAALAHPTVMCGFIADGEHITPTMLKLLLRSGVYDRGLFLVSDALAALGLPDGTYPWDTRSVTITNGTARLDNGTLAGTTLSLLKGVQNIVRWGICESEQAIALATSAPRRAIGQAGLSLSQPGTLLRWHLDRINGEPHLTWNRLNLQELAS